MAKKIVIVGGVGGGATVAAQIRRNDPDATIILFNKDKYIAFSNCGMPYYIGGIVEKRDDLLVSPTDFAEKYDIDIHTDAEVTSIDRNRKSIGYTTGEKTDTETYDKLLLAPGASPIVPDIPGSDAHNVFTLRLIPDMDQIESYIQQHQPQSAAIIGTGFIGLEMVENLHHLGMECTMVDRSKQVIKIVDENMASIIQDHLEEKGVRVLLEEELQSISENGRKLHLHSGQTISADMTILALGIQPNSALAKEADLDLGLKGAVQVNEYMQTNDPDIYALGDVVETNDFLTDEPRHIALAGPAHRQAYIIANHLEGENIPYRGSIGASILKVFDLTVAASGPGEKRLKELSYPFKEVTSNAYEHAGYYPGSEKLTIKVLFDAESGVVYGGQAVGFGGVDKRHAVLATAIKGGMTVAELSDLELAYAPPYSSPKDPINIIGYKALAKMEN